MNLVHCWPWLTLSVLHLHTPGQVQTRECIEAVIRFAFEEGLFLMADEVHMHRRTPGRGDPSAALE